MSTPPVSVVIVSFNAGQRLNACIASLYEQTLQPVEKIVVDNNSVDNSMACLAQFPDVKQVPNAQNQGFAAGQNQGIAIAQGEYVVTLNYDLTLSHTFLEQLIGALGSTPEAGWGCGKLLNMTPDGRKLRTIYAAGHVFAPDRFRFLRGNGETDVGQYDRQEYVFGAPAAAAMYKREMMLDVSFKGQFFDERLFTWYEDVDVDWRATRAGWRCLYVPSATAYHVGHVGEEYAEPYCSWRTAYGIRNRWLTIAANDSLAGLWTARASLIQYELSSLMYVSRKGLIKAYLRAVYGALLATPYTLSKRRMPVGTHLRSGAIPAQDGKRDGARTGSP